MSTLFYDRDQLAEALNDAAEMAEFDPSFWPLTPAQLCDDPSRDDWTASEKEELIYLMGALFGLDGDKLKLVNPEGVQIMVAKLPKRNIALHASRPVESSDYRDIVWSIGPIVP